MLLKILAASLAFGEMPRAQGGSTAAQSDMVEEARRVDSTGGTWWSGDSLTQQVTYFERKEAYRLTAHNGQGQPETGNLKAVRITAP